MITTDDAVDILTVAAHYDRRKIGISDAQAWEDAGNRSRWTRDEAIEAVKAHYARDTTWIMPGHITDLIRAERRQPAPFVRPEPLALPAGVQMRAMPSADEPAPWRPWNARKRRKLTDEGRAAARAELDRIRAAEADA